MRADAVSTCPRCGRGGVPLLFGLPVPAARLAAKQGEIRLAGCRKPEVAPNWACARRHRWRDVWDRRGWDARLLRALKEQGYPSRLDLDDLDAEVQRRTERWRAFGLTWEITRGPLTDKPAAWLTLTAASGAVGELILWVSGEAEMTWSASSKVDGPGEEHYDLTSVFGLRECLYDLEAHLGFPEHVP